MKRLPARCRATVDLRTNLHAEDVPRPDSVLFISRLADVPPSGAGKAWPVAESKHVLFLEGLPVEAMPARLLQLNIRNPQRLHIAAQRSPQRIVELVYRLVSGIARGHGPRPIVDAWIEDGRLVLLAPSFDRLAVPLDRLAGLIGNDEKTAGAFEFDEDGRYLYWPHADVHLGWDQFLQIVDPAAALTDRQKSANFNRKYGAAIRALREERGLTQSAVEGLTQRHLRRVEHGQQAASKATLSALATAHKMSLDDYLKALANRLGTRD